MKQVIAISVLSLLNVQLDFIPSVGLLAVMGIALFLDLVTGITKAIFAKQQRTSEGYRKTVVKVMQYFGSVGLSMIVTYASKNLTPFAEWGIIAEYMGNGLLLFIIFIEVTSIFENMYAIDDKTPFAKYVIKPILNIMTFQIKNNALLKRAEQETGGKEEAGTL